MLPHEKQQPCSQKPAKTWGEQLQGYTIVATCWDQVMLTVGVLRRADFFCLPSQQKGMRIELERANPSFTKCLWTRTCLKSHVQMLDCYISYALFEPYSCFRGPQGSHSQNETPHLPPRSVSSAVSAPSAAMELGGPDAGTGLRDSRVS